MNSFTDIELTETSLDRFYIRTSIFSALKCCSVQFAGRFLDVGCGKMPYRDYIQKNSNVDDYVGLDIESAIEYSNEVKPDYTWDGRVMPFLDAEFDSVMATEVLEHCPTPDAFLREVSRVLKPQGTLFMTVPFLWPLHEIPYDMYRYTPWSLSNLLEDADFENIEVRALGGWNASMAQMLGLWIRRSGMSDRKREMLSVLMKPVISYLIKRDTIPEKFSDNTMVTGFSVNASRK